MHLAKVHKSHGKNLGNFGIIWKTYGAVFGVAFFVGSGSLNPKETIKTKLKITSC